jgi:hypothetical protein
MYFTRFGDPGTYSEYFGQAALRGSAWDGTVRISPSVYQSSQDDSIREDRLPILVYDMSTSRSLPV